MTDRNLALSKLNAIVETGKERAAAGMTALMDEYTHRRDLMVRPDALDFAVTDSIRPIVDGQPYSLTPHSRSQLLARASIPAVFADTLTERHLSDLLRENLRRLLGATSADGILLRTVTGQDSGTIKGVLSASYRRLDASPLFEAFMERTLSAGFVPYSGDVTDTRAFLSVIRPTVSEIAPNEYVVFGLQFRSSDYGRGAMELDLMIVRLLCTNGLVGSNVLRQIHVGRRFSRDDFDGSPVVELSRQTIQLDAWTVQSALRDAVRGADRHLALLEGNLKEHAADGIDVSKALVVLQKKGVRKDTINKIATMYEQPLPIEAVPQEPGRWRFAQVLSLIANGTQGDDAHDLQDAAYHVMFPSARA